MINLRLLTPHIMPCYTPQNGDRIAAIDSVTSLLPMYNLYLARIVRNFAAGWFPSSSKSIPIITCISCARRPASLYKNYESSQPREQCRCSKRPTAGPLDPSAGVTASNGTGSVHGWSLRSVHCRRIKTSYAELTACLMTTTRTQISLSSRNCCRKWQYRDAVSRVSERARLRDCADEILSAWKNYVSESERSLVAERLGLPKVKLRDWFDSR